MKLADDDMAYKKVYTDVQNAYIQEYLLRSVVNTINWDILLASLLIDQERKMRVMVRINQNMEYMADIAKRGELILGIEYVNKKVQSIRKHKKLSTCMGEWAKIKRLTPETTDYYARKYNGGASC